MSNPTPLETAKEIIKKLGELKFYRVADGGLHTQDVLALSQAFIEAVSVIEQITFHRGTDAGSINAANYTLAREFLTKHSGKI